MLCDSAFFYSGYGDRTSCFMCGGVVKNWQPEDQPDEEHLRLYPACPFMLLKKCTEYDSKNTMNMICQLCNKNVVEIVYLPCKHIVTSETCVDKRESCLKCNKTILAYIRVYLS